MRYVIRSIKYFFYICLLLVVVIAALVALKLVDGDISTMFRHGYNSLWMMAGIFALFSAVYPVFGYTKRQIYVQGVTMEDIRKATDELMPLKGYAPETVSGSKLTFRRKNIVQKFTRMWEDRITFFEKDGCIYAEGLRKDIVGIVMHLEQKLRNGEQD